jgi:hypothetical protein
MSRVGWPAERSEEAHLVLATREKVRMVGRHRKPTYSGDMTGERQPQLTRSEVPDLDDAVRGTSCEPHVSGLDSNAAHPGDPTQVPGNNAHELPWCMVCRLEFGGIGKR